MFSLRWTRLHRFVVFGPTESFRCNRSLQLSATDFTIGKTVCHLFCVSSDPAPLNESCPLQASHFYHCFMLWLKDQTHSWQIPEGERDYIFIKPFLEIDVKGGERDHIKAYHLERSHQRGRVSPPQGEKEISRGREYSSRKYFSRIPDAWCSRGEMPHVFLRGKYMFICAYLH